MKNTRTDNTEPGRRGGGQGSAPGNPAGRERRLRKMQSRIGKMRRNSIIGIVLAAVLLIVTIAGFRISSDNEQAIRLALGQKNYKVTGEEGPQYFEAE